MKKRISAVVMVFFGMVLLANAQPENTILLTNYSFTPENGVIGVIHVKGQNDPSLKFQLKGKNASHFTIDANRQLIIKEKYRRAGNKWYDLTIQAQTGGKKISENLRIVKDEFFANKVIAHQGAWRNSGSIGNSIASLKRAIELQCGGTEFDVHMSADSVLFVHHDRHLQGIHIEENICFGIIEA